MSDVPEELLAQVLSRISVESLLRFRCVSKRWCSLIDSPNFIKLHLNQSIETNSNLFLIVGHRGLYSVDLDSLDTVADARKNNYPLKPHEIGPHILGSCNGLLCLSKKEEDILFWNLKTRKSWKLPVSPIEVSRGSGFDPVINYSFGYDCVNDDYKLMRMVYFHSANDELVASEVEVYSLKSNSWRKGQNFPFPCYLRYKRWPGMFVNGALHWPVRQELESDIAHLIVSFDVATEEYGLVPLPECFDNNFRMGLGLAVLGGCLCVQCNYYRHRDIDNKWVCNYCPARVDTWVMKDYRVKESWTKLISLVQHSELRSFEEVTPIAYSKNGRRVLMQQDDNEFFWYDLENKTIKSVTIHGMPNYIYNGVCLGSLVQPSGGGGGGSDGKEQET